MTLFSRIIEGGFGEKSINSLDIFRVWFDCEECVLGFDGFLQLSRSANAGGLA
jgi:hypothetical protein